MLDYRDGWLVPCLDGDVVYVMLIYGDWWVRAIRPATGVARHDLPGTLYFG